MTFILKGIAIHIGTYWHAGPVGGDTVHITSPTCQTREDPLKHSELFPIWWYSIYRPKTLFENGREVRKISVLPNIHKLAKTVTFCVLTIKCNKSRVRNLFREDQLVLKIIYVAILLFCLKKPFYRIHRNLNNIPFKISKYRCKHLKSK